MFFAMRVPIILTFPLMIRRGRQVTVPFKAYGNLYHAIAISKAVPKIFEVLIISIQSVSQES